MGLATCASNVFPEYIGKLKSSFSFNEFVQSWPLSTGAILRKDGLVGLVLTQTSDPK